MEKVDKAVVDEMGTRNLIEKAGAAIAIAQEETQIVEHQLGEARKQVDNVLAQIAAREAEIRAADSAGAQFVEFCKGVGESAYKLTGNVLDLFENPSTSLPTQSGLTAREAYNFAGAASKLSGSEGFGAFVSGEAAMLTGFGAFAYAGVSAMNSIGEASEKRAADLKTLKEVTLPAANALVELKQREKHIAQLRGAIAQADFEYGKKLLAFYTERFLNRAFWVNMTAFANQLMRRYLDLAGRTAWFAERSLAFEQDRDLNIIGFDYFPRALRGVSGADLLALHLNELEATRIQALSQTTPVKHSISLSRDFPVAFGRLKAAGRCRFTTMEEPLRLVYPGVYGYRVRCVTIALSYADTTPPHRGILANQGVSLVTRSAGSAHVLTRYPDALPISEFRMRNDMFVFDLPDETLLPFEGSGIETDWELSFPQAGNANSLEGLADVSITFDLRANFSRVLQAAHEAAMPQTVKRSLLFSGKAFNPGAIPSFLGTPPGAELRLRFDVPAIAANPTELKRRIANVALIAVGLPQTRFRGTFGAAGPGQTVPVRFDQGIATSNAGPLADGGAASPLNAFENTSLNRVFTFSIKRSANAGVDFASLKDVLFYADYEATLAT